MSPCLKGEDKVHRPLTIDGEVPAKLAYIHKLQRAFVKGTEAERPVTMSALVCGNQESLQGDCRPPSACGAFVIFCSKRISAEGKLNIHTARPAQFTIPVHKPSLVDKADVEEPRSQCTDCPNIVELTIQWTCTVSLPTASVPWFRIFIFSSALFCLACVEPDPELGTILHVRAYTPCGDIPDG